MSPEAAVTARTSKEGRVASSLDQTGVMQVNGAWATSVRYSTDVGGPASGSTEVRFMQGRIEIASARIQSADLPGLLGEENTARIARHVAGDADKYLATVRGELRGRRLTYGEVELPGQEPRLEENAIGVARSREAPASETAESRRAPRLEEAAAATELTGDRRTSARQEVPPSIAAKYLVQGDRYHFDDRTVAFTDNGSSLTVSTQNRAVIKDLIEIAKAREWREITLSGSKSFRREAWREATAAGLAVRGYKPSALEHAAVDRDLERRHRNEGQVPQSDRGAPASSSAESARAPTDALNARRSAAPSRAQQAAAAIRSAEITRQELQLKYPELNKAVFQRLASHDLFAEAYVKAGLIRESDRAQVIVQMRERLAAQVEQHSAPLEAPDETRVNALIRRSVNRVAADIGRPVAEVRAAPVKAVATPTPVVREDVQVRG